MFGQRVYGERSFFAQTSPLRFHRANSDFADRDVQFFLAVVGCCVSEDFEIFDGAFRVEFQVPGLLEGSLDGLLFLIDPFLVFF